MTLLLYILGALLLVIVAIGVVILSVKLGLKITGTQEDRSSELIDDTKKRGKR